MNIRVNEKLPHLEILLASADDTEAIAQVHVESWRATYAGLLSQEVLDRVTVKARAEQWRARLVDASTPTTTFVARANGELVGFASIGPARDQDLTSQDNELHAIYTAPRAWRSGVGTALLRSALAQAGSAPRVVLWVASENARAIAFYRRHGFMPDGHAIEKPVFGGLLREARFTIDGRAGA